MEASDADILKEAGAKRELKTAKTTAIDPRTFETIVICENGTEADQECNQGIIVQDRHRHRPDSDPRSPLGATRQGLSEHARDGARRKEPGRQAHHVHAALFTGA